LIRSTKFSAGPMSASMKTWPSPNSTSSAS
jgi:hypothetical protein